MSDNEVNWLPVVEAGRLIGVLNVRDVMAAYRLALKGGSRQLQGPSYGGTLVEAAVAPGSRLVGTSIAAIGWPRDAVVVAVQHDGALVVPRGNVVIAAGDRLSVFAAPTALRDVQALLSIEQSPAAGQAAAASGEAATGMPRAPVW